LIQDAMRCSRSNWVRPCGRGIELDDRAVKPAPIGLQCSVVDARHACVAGQNLRERGVSMIEAIRLNESACKQPRGQERDGSSFATS
jgi:hypothetical protein